MALKLYVDMMSQPCRAIFMFMKISGISFQTVEIAIRKGEHKQDTFLKINPLGKLPTLTDQDFVLTESVAIFRYLTEKYTYPEHFYPKALKERAKVDEYLEWQHLNTRYTAGRVFIFEVIMRSDVTSYVEEMNTMLDQLDFMFLKDKPFLTGNNVSFADILAVCEIIQPTMSGRDVLAGRPKLQQWMARVKEATQPHFDDAHKIFYLARENITKRNKL